MFLYYMKYCLTNHSVPHKHFKFTVYSDLFYDINILCNIMMIYDIVRHANVVMSIIMC